MSMTATAFRSALDMLGMTAEQFAERCGVHRVTVFRWLRDDKVPAWARLAIPASPDAPMRMCQNP